MKLQGIFAEITTPFDHKGDIYKTKVEHNVEKWNRTTLAGYVVCGRAGEGALLAGGGKAPGGAGGGEDAGAGKERVAGHGKTGGCAGVGPATPPGGPRV